MSNITPPSNSMFFHSPTTSIASVFLTNMLCLIYTELLIFLVGRYFPYTDMHSGGSLIACTSAAAAAAAGRHDKKRQKCSEGQDMISYVPT